MANSTYVITIPDLHQGPAYFYPVVLAPFDGSRFLVDQYGQPQNPAASQWTASVKGLAIPLGFSFWDGANIQIAVQAGTAGSGAEPTWSTYTYPATGTLAQAKTTDGTCVFANVGTPTAAGATDPANAEVTIDTKTEAVVIDQNTAQVDEIMIAQAASITLTLKESSMRKIWWGTPGGLYTSGTDTGLPANAQTYEELTFGGLQLPNLLAPSVGIACALVSPRRGYTAPGKYMVTCLYNAVSKGAWKIGYSRSKESLWKLEIHGMAQLFRTTGNQLVQMFRQT